MLNIQKNRSSHSVIDCPKVYCLEYQLIQNYKIKIIGFLLKNNISNFLYAQRRKIYAQIRLKVN